MKTFLSFFITFVCAFTAFAQTSDQAANVWLGTDEADAQNWHNANNWSKGQVPSAMETVIILDNLSDENAIYPVLSQDAEISVLQVAPHAELTITPNATLMITGHALDSDFSTSNVFNQGNMHFQYNTAMIARSEGVQQATFCKADAYYCHIE